MIEKWDQEIEAIHKKLAEVGPMRPGTLSRQYHKPAEQEGGYWQLSYTHLRRSYTEHVREEELEEVRGQLEEYRKFKELSVGWVDLALQRARRLRQLKRRKPGAPGNSR